jgi:glycosyltransferase involved in cell wall biosynthesis
MVYGPSLQPLDRTVEPAFASNLPTNARFTAAPIVPIFHRSSTVVYAAAQHERALAVVGTSLPRKCGIATFTADVVEQLKEYHPEIASQVFALDAGSGHRYPAGITAIPQDNAESYAAAARQINESGAQVVWLQHEFGIFGGKDGELVCDFACQIAAPLVVTFHTVLYEPSANQRRVVEHLIARASRIMVMSRHARELLVGIYNAPAERISVIPHGAPDRPFGRAEEFKRKRGLAGQNVLMTFGLLGPGKGLEHAIAALPKVVARHPDTVYRIVGATHPNLLADQGETYRDQLIALAERLGVADHIEWDNRFLDTPELLDQLEACDIYLTPYPNLQQATSGTLSYAVALGKAVVSTPYVHARELLAGEVGMLVAPSSSSAIADAVNRLLDDRDLLSAVQRRAYAAGRETIWPRFAQASAALIRKASVEPAGDISLTAVPGLSGFLAMCDSTGIYQHAIGIVPDRRHGYCLDDNVRALMVMNHVTGVDPGERLAWSSTFASFIQYAWNPNAHRFRNFMRFDRSWCEEHGSEDSNGRTLWALGDTVAHSPIPGLRDWARSWFDEVLPSLDTIDSPRALAFSMLGAAALVRSDGGHAGAEALLKRGAQVLERLLAESRRPDWAWFEAVLAYDNPRLPQALIEAGQVLGRSEWTALGLSTLAWICDRQTSPAGLFRPVGSEGFGRSYEQMPFDQQPLEAQAAIEACLAASRAEADTRWHRHGEVAYRWFFGANDRGAVLVDLATGRCRDGVTPRGANLNCGAESILAFQLGHCALQHLLIEQKKQPQAREAVAEKYDGRARTLAHP